MIYIFQKNFEDLNIYISYDNLSKLIVSELVFLYILFDKILKDCFGKYWIDKKGKYKVLYLLI